MTRIAVRAGIVTACFFAATCAGYAMAVTGLSG
jgi:hypothetical protein